MIVGAHSVGRCHLENSGFAGRWDNTELTLDNHYYKSLVGTEWKSTKISQGYITAVELMLYSLTVVLNADTEQSHFYQEEHSLVIICKVLKTTELEFLGFQLHSSTTQYKTYHSKRLNVFK